MSIDFEAGLAARYPVLMDVIRAVVYGCGRPLKAVAADMDLSQSELSRKLAQNPNDPRHLGVDELPALMDACGDRANDIVHWLIERYLEDAGARQARAREALLEMAPRFAALMAQAMEEQPRSETDKRRATWP